MRARASLQAEWARYALVAAVVTSTVTTTANAQIAVIRGVVEDTTGAPVSAAQIALNGTRIAGITNERGEFRIAMAQAGRYELQVRCIGLAVLTTSVDVQDNDTLALWFGIVPQGTLIAPVLVKGVYSSQRLFDVGFDRRRMTSSVSSSQFVTRADIEKHGAIDLSSMFFRMGARARGCVKEASIFIDGVLQGSLSSDVLNPSSPGTPPGAFARMPLPAPIGQIPARIVRNGRLCRSRANSAGLQAARERHSSAVRRADLDAINTATSARQSDR